MGSGNANDFFQAIEIQAKLAGLQHNEGEQGKMVQAVRWGIPQSYAKTIANQGIHTPETYPEWKEHISQLYIDCIKQTIFEQTLGCPNEQHQDQ